MALAFPAGPTAGQTFTSAGKTWAFDGTAWTLLAGGSNGNGGGGKSPLPDLDGGTLIEAAQVYDNYAEDMYDGGTL